MKTVKNVAVVHFSWDVKLVVAQSKLSSLLDVLNSAQPVQTHYINGEVFVESDFVPRIELMNSLTVLDSEELKSLQEADARNKATKLNSPEASCSVEPTKD